jgi:glutamyl-tRNA reductase
VRRDQRPDFQGLLDGVVDCLAFIGAWRVQHVIDDFLLACREIAGMADTDAQTPEVLRSKYGGNVLHAIARKTSSELELRLAGREIELVARHLIESKARRLIVANRTLEHAQVLATRFGGYAIALSDLPRHLAEADIVISSTASREPVLLRGQIAAAIAARRRKPMFLVDIAVPRDIDPAAADLEDVYLYTIDDLRGIIDENLRSRREAAIEAEAMIELSVEHFMGWWRTLDARNPVVALRRVAEAEEGVGFEEELRHRAGRPGV